MQHPEPVARRLFVGDVLVGRVLDRAQRRASARWLRWWLAVPFLFFVLRPGTPVAALLAGCACPGYAATLAQQELLVELTPPELSGQVLGAGHAIAKLAIVSLLVAAALTRPLTRATQPRPDKLYHPAGPMIATNDSRRT